MAIFCCDHYYLRIPVACSVCSLCTYVCCPCSDNGISSFFPPTGISHFLRGLPQFVGNYTHTCARRCPLHWSHVYACSEPVCLSIATIKHRHREVCPSLSLSHTHNYCLRATRTRRACQPTDRLKRARSGGICLNDHFSCSHNQSANQCIYRPEPTIVPKADWDK